MSGINAAVYKCTKLLCVAAKVKNIKSLLYLIYHQREVCTVIKYVNNLHLNIQQPLEMCIFFLLFTILSDQLYFIIRSKIK